MNIAAANLSGGEWLLMAAVAAIFVAGLAAIAGVIYLAVRKPRRLESKPPPVPKESR